MLLNDGFRFGPDLYRQTLRTYRHRWPRLAGSGYCSVDEGRRQAHEAIIATVLTRHVLKIDGKDDGKI